MLAAFAGRILNVIRHSSRSFPGLHGARDVLAAGVAVSGVMVDLVDATLDGGPIVAQEAVREVFPGDTEETLLARITLSSTACCRRPLRCCSALRSRDGGAPGQSGHRGG